MILEKLTFYFFVALTVIPTVYMVLSKQILYIAFALMLSFLGITGLYVFAGAEFIAVTQIMIYVGGILVLLLFGIMFTKRSSTKLLVTENRNVLSGSLLVLAIFSSIGWIFYKTDFKKIDTLQQGTSSLVTADEKFRNLGISLMTDYVLAFELAGVLLLVALIGAAFIAGKKTHD
ncbi:MAG: NADH-quinone oxidoreductase subunit J [Bacteroidota bacterium]